MKNIHYTANYLINPTNPISICLIGAGGTGSHLLTNLAKINVSLNALNHPGLMVYTIDDDTVSEANIGRQLFSTSEIGLHKAVALTNRINRFFGTNWKAVPQKFNTQNYLPSNLIITCVDSAQARFNIAQILKDKHRQFHNSANTAYYWMDFGNSKTTGQIILSTLSAIKQPKTKQFKPISNLPLITEEFKEELLNADTHDHSPSCSIAQALQHQDLFINSSLASLGASMLWNLFKNGFTHHRGMFLNLDGFTANPIGV